MKTIFPLRRSAIGVGCSPIGKDVGPKEVLTFCANRSVSVSTSHWKRPEMTFGRTTTRNGKGRPMQGIRKSVVAGLAILVLGLGAPPAYAATFNLSLAQIDAWVQIDSLTTNPPPGLDGAGPDPGTLTTVIKSTKFNTTFTNFNTIFDATPSTTDLETVTVANATAASLNMVGFDTLSLFVVNDNETTWLFQLFVVDGSFNEASSIGSGPNSETPINVNTGAQLDVDISGLLLTDIDFIRLAVSCVLPCDMVNDVTIEFNVSPVPLPAALALFGPAVAGLLGFGYIRRRREEDGESLAA